MAALDAFTTVISVSVRVALVSTDPSAFRCTWKYGTRSVAAGRWSIVQVTAIALEATATNATTTSR